MSHGRRTSDLKPLGTYTQPATQEAMDQIKATFSGEDGSYPRFATLMQELDEKAAKGDDAAQQVVVNVQRVGRLIKLANRR